MARWGRLLAEIRRPVDDRLFELVTFVVARELKNSSCSMEHGRQLAKFIGEETVIAISRGEDPDVLSDAEIAAMQFARALTKDASKITHGQVEALKKIHGFSDEEIFDIVAIASGRCFFTKILDALGSEPDVGFMSIDQKMRESVGIGRPINHAQPERVTV